MSSASCSIPRCCNAWVVAAHRRACRVALADAGPLHRVAIVGGGLFPRTALVLHELLPFLYDENVRVPFLVAAPGAIDGPSRNGTIVSLIDTAPTILDLLGLPRATYQGHSALDGWSRMALFFADYSLSLVGLRDGRWKFVHDLTTGRSMLFALARDPAERVNVASDQRPRVEAYVRALDDWSAAQKALMRHD